MMLSRTDPMVKGNSGMVRRVKKRNWHGAEVLLYSGMYGVEVVVE